ncbi:putative RNA-binding protein [Desulfitispora alkaliphila]|uniref:CooT family nickel-binding protein n=1 Tax=Desulfitispora alkaliphila TaxID=622674 RepID=UPI003D19CDC9
MCEASAFFINESGEEELVLESVDKLVPQGEELVMENIFGQKKIVKAKVKELSLLEHKIYLERV